MSVDINICGGQIQICISLISIKEANIKRVILHVYFISARNHFVFVVEILTISPQTSTYI